MAQGEKMQADGGGRKGQDPTGAGRGEGGESGGGSSPLDQGGDGAGDSSVMGHGGQSEIGYHGPGQLGDEKTGGPESPNAPAHQQD